MLVEHLLAEGAIETFDVGVLVGFAGLDVLNGYTTGLGPLRKGFAQELRPVVRSQHLRLAMVASDLFEDADEPRGGDRGINHDMQRLAVEIVDHVKRAEAPPQASASLMRSIDHTVSGSRDTLTAPRVRA